MPGLLRSNDTSMAIRPIEQSQQNPVSNENGVPHDPAPQPRQPRSLQGLLRFAMEATRNEDAPGPSNLRPMDDQRRKFLEDALKSMTIDVIEVLIRQIKVFDNVATVTAQSDVAEYCRAFETILDYVDNIDVANDFYKIGGFTIFDPCLQCEHPKIKAGACELLAELCQNNPFCQMITIDNDFLPELVEILEKEEDDEVCVKAIYAVSCIVRGNFEGCYKLLEHNGLEAILKMIKKNDDKLRTKSAYFLSDLCRMRADIIEKLINLGLLPVLINILSEEHLPSHEYVTLLMKIMIECSLEAADICKNPVHNLQNILKENHDFTKDKEEYYEEFDYCQNLLNRLFPGWEN